MDSAEMKSPSVILRYDAEHNGRNKHQQAKIVTGPCRREQPIVIESIFIFYKTRGD